MSEPILKALIKLFVLISDARSISEISNREKDIVKLFLQRQLSSDLVKKYMEIFDEFLAEYYSQQIDKGSLKEKSTGSILVPKATQNFYSEGLALFSLELVRGALSWGGVALAGASGAFSDDF